MKKLLVILLVFIGIYAKGQDYYVKDLPEYTAVANDSTDVLYLDDSGIDKHIEMPTLIKLVSDSTNQLRQETSDSITQLRSELRGGGLPEGWTSDTFTIRTVLYQSSDATDTAIYILQSETATGIIIEGSSTSGSTGISIISNGGTSYNAWSYSGNNFKSTGYYGTAYLFMGVYNTDTVFYVKGDSLFLPKLANDTLGFAVITSTGGVAAGILDPVSRGLTDPLINFKEWLKDRVNGEIKWRYIQNGEVKESYGLPGGMDNFESLQYKVEMLIRDQVRQDKLITGLIIYASILSILILFIIIKKRK